MIAEAEERLNVSFPVSYRQFLARYGAALCAGFEIAGVFKVGNEDEPPLWSDVVTSTNQLRRGSRGSLPLGYIAISDDGGDYNFFLDTSRRRADGECPVAVMGPGADGVVVATDFLDFVARAFAGRITF